MIKAMAPKFECKFALKLKKTFYPFTVNPGTEILPPLCMRNWLPVEKRRRDRPAPSLIRSLREVVWTTCGAGAFSREDPFAVGALPGDVEEAGRATPWILRAKET